MSLSERPLLHTQIEQPPPSPISTPSDPNLNQFISLEVLDDFHKKMQIKSLLKKLRKEKFIRALQLQKQQKKQAARINNLLFQQAKVQEAQKQRLLEERRQKILKNLHKIEQEKKQRAVEHKQFLMRLRLIKQRKVEEKPLQLIIPEQQAEIKQRIPSLTQLQESSKEHDREMRQHSLEMVKKRQQNQQKIKQGAKRYYRSKIFSSINQTKQQLARSQELLKDRQKKLKDFSLRVRLQLFQKGLPCQDKSESKSQERRDQDGRVLGNLYLRALRDLPKRKAKQNYQQFNNQFLQIQSQQKKPAKQPFSPLQYNPLYSPSPSQVKCPQSRLQAQLHLNRVKARDLLLFQESRKGLDEEGEKNRKIVESIDLKLKMLRALSN